MESLTKRLQAVWNEVDGSDHPLRSPLMASISSVLGDVRAMEENFGFPDLVKENESLKEKLSALESDKSTQMEVLRKELEALRKEKSEQENKYAPDLPRAQLRILQGLPSPSQESWRPSQISNRLRIPQDEVDFHLGKLLGLKLIDGGSTGWTRSTKGNQDVIAMRLSQESELKLCKFDEDMLASLHRMSGQEGVSSSIFYAVIAQHGATFTEDTVCEALADFCCLGFCRPYGQYFEEDLWFVEQRGTDYLRKRKLI